MGQAHALPGQPGQWQTRLVRGETNRRPGPRTSQAAVSLPEGHCTGPRGPLPGPAIPATLSGRTTGTSSLPPHGGSRSPARPLEPAGRFGAAFGATRRGARRCRALGCGWEERGSCHPARSSQRVTQQSKVVGGCARSTSNGVGESGSEILGAIVEAVDGIARYGDPRSRLRRGRVSLIGPSGVFRPCGQHRRTTGCHRPLWTLLPDASRPPAEGRVQEVQARRRRWQPRLPTSTGP